MDSEKRTTESILAKLKELVESKHIISPEEWIDAAVFLGILKHDENNKRLSLEIIAKKKRKELKDTGLKGTGLDTEWEITEEWQNWQRQENLIEDIVDFIRIAKKEADIRKIM